MNNVKHTPGLVRVRGTGVFLALLSLVLLSGCVKRDLEYRIGIPDTGEGKVEIALDWGGDNRPKEARYLFYREEDGTLYRSFEGISDSYKGNLPAGKYRLIVHNTDATRVGFCGMENYATAFVFALSEESVKSLRGGGACIQEPDGVYGIGQCKAGVTLDVRKDETLISTVYPHCLTRQVKLHFELENMQMEQIGGYLNGVTPSVLLATGECRPANCAVAFTTTNQVQGTEFTAAVQVFNLRTAEQFAPNSNTLDVTLTDAAGQGHNTTIDITDTVKEVIDKNGGKVPIEIPVKIELVLIDNGNLQAIVTPWDDGGTGGGHPFPDN